VRGARRHLGRLRERAELEGDVDAGALVDLQDDAAPDVLRKPCTVDVELVGAGMRKGAAKLPSCR